MSRKRRGRGKGGGAAAPALPLTQAQPRGVGGRATKCTPEVTQLVVEAILKGAGREDAASSAKVSAPTFYRWMADGEQQESGVFREFREAVEEAERELVLKASAGMVDLTADDVPPAVRFAALKLILQSRRPALWRPAKELEITGRDGGPVEVAHSGAVEVRPVIDASALAALTDEQLEALGRGLGEP